jgi:hypothetical protein
MQFKQTALASCLHRGMPPKVSEDVLILTMYNVMNYYNILSKRPMNRF